MPEVSVIIPNYNHAEYLDLRIKSVLDQTYQDFEIIILDDRSTDNSRSVIEQYRNHEKVTDIIFNVANSGSTFKQWHTGINLAKGKYIWIAESDDWCDKTCLETLIGGLVKNKNCVLAYVQSYIIRNGNKIDMISAHSCIYEYIDGRKYISEYLTSKNSIINASAVIFKKDCYTNVPQLFTTFKYCGDWLFWIEIAKQGDVFISGKVLNYFRKHGKDITGKVLKTGYNIIEELEILKILKTQLIITEVDFKQNLLDRYLGYLLNKNKFTKDICEKIEGSFYLTDYKSYKRFLSLRHNKLSLISFKVKRKLRKLLN